MRFRLGDVTHNVIENHGETGRGELVWRTRGAQLRLPYRWNTGAERALVLRERMLKMQYAVEDNLSQADLDRVAGVTNDAL